jgi:phage tail sheath protein FI
VSRPRALPARRGRDPIPAAPSSVAAFVGSVPGGPLETPHLVTSLAGFERVFGGVEGEAGDAVRLFFENGGARAYVVGTRDDPLQALQALREVDFQLLAVPATGSTGDPRLAVAAALLAEKRRAFYVADPPAGRTAADIERWARAFGGGSHSAVYFPRLQIPEPGRNREVPAAGAVLGAYARVDRDRGVWKQPAGPDVGLSGVVGLIPQLTSAEARRLAAAGVNAVRRSSAGRVYLAAGRTREERGAEYKYVNVRRLALFLEESLDRGTQWALFEPNDERLWNEIRLDVRDFLLGVFRAGALRGSTPKEAFFVRCDRTTMTQNDIENGRLIFTVGFAPLKPAEFVVFRIGHRLGRAS